MAKLLVSRIVSFMTFYIPHFNLKKKYLKESLYVTDGVILPLSPCPD